MYEIYAMQRDYAVSYLEAVYNVTAEERAAALDRFGGEALPSILEVNGPEAVINVSGPLSPTGPSPIARFLGFNGTAYSDIVAAKDAILANPEVSRVRVKMDTPGGTVSGMDSARQALKDLRAAGLHVTAENVGMIASAGYNIATTADEIVATSDNAVTGSIGIIIAGIDPSKAMEKFGLRKVRIVSSNAPNKAPDPSTEHGLSVLQDQVDAMERVFIANVAEGRGVTTEKVLADFGRGGLLIANDPDPSKPDAVSVGMIDRVGQSGIGAGSGGLMAGATTFEDLPIVDQPWDSAAAVRRVRRFLNSEEAPSRGYRRAFFWYDSQNADQYGAYKLPFADVVDGRLVAIWNGISAANGAMSGARGNRVDIPDTDRPRVQAHIDRYREKWNSQKENGGSAAAGGDVSVPVSKSAEGGEQQEGPLMDLNQLKAEHPALYTAAVQMGAEEERDRVTAHLKLGQTSGDMDFAAKCIEDGKGFTASVQAHYMGAHMQRVEQNARAGESEGDLDTGGDAGAEEVDELDATAAKALAEKWGVEL